MKLTVSNEELDEVIEFFLGIARRNSLTSAIELKKYYYTHTYDDKKTKMIKKVFTAYGEMNFFNCILFYISSIIKTKSMLSKKIKGEV